LKLTKLSVIFFILLLAQMSAKADDGLRVMTDSPQFIEQVNEKQGVGTISSVYSLLFKEIGLPEQLR